MQGDGQPVIAVPPHKAANGARPVPDLDRLDPVEVLRQPAHQQPQHGACMDGPQTVVVTRPEGDMRVRTAIDPQGTRVSEDVRVVAGGREAQGDVFSGLARNASDVIGPGADAGRFG